MPVNQIRNRQRAYFFEAVLPDAGKREFVR
jgi:hypothetical protein